MRKIIFFYYLCALLMFCSCNVESDHPPVIADPQPSVQPKQSANESENSMPTGIFDQDPVGADAWRLFTEEGRYRVARTKDFKIPKAASENKDHRQDVERAINFAYVGEDINRDGLYKDRAFIVVDTTRSDPAKFGLVIFNEREDKARLPEPHWIYRERDMSKTVMSWAGGEIILVEYHDDGTYDLCRIKWDRSAQKYSCVPGISFG
jgi:hypothetical protein